MSTETITPRLADRFCLLAVSQLQTQMSRSGTLDTSALAVVSACAAIAAIVLGVRSAHHLWIAALAMLILALGLALRALRLPGAEENGPSVVEMLDARASNDDALLEESLLEDLAEDVHTNEQTLDRKDRLLARAVTLLVFAIALELAGVQ
jgi:apolipoprotein N-acyltransferase